MGFEGYDDWKCRDVSYENGDREEQAMNEAEIMLVERMKWEREMADRGHGETTVPDHRHECFCGVWMCNDETCENQFGDNYDNWGWKECPWCEPHPDGEWHDSSF